MNLTVDTLAPLEDSLVAEITEHERGKCESNHGDPRNPPCTVTVVAIESLKCKPGGHLVCASHVAYVQLAAASGGKCECFRPVADCWSVVVLP